MRRDAGRSGRGPRAAAGAGRRARGIEAATVAAAAAGPGVGAGRARADLRLRGRRAERPRPRPRWCHLHQRRVLLARAPGLIPRPRRGSIYQVFFKILFNNHYPPQAQLQGENFHLENQPSAYETSCVNVATY